MGDNNEEINMNDVVVAQPAAADKNELIMQLMQQIAEMRVEMQRMQDGSNPVSSFNPPRDGRPPLHFPPSNAEQVQNILSNPAQNPPAIDSTTPNPHVVSSTTSSSQYQSNPSAPSKPKYEQCSNLPHLQNQNTNPQTFPQNYQATQNTQNPSIVPPIPQKTTLQIPTSNEPYADWLDRYKEQEREWRSKEEVFKVNMKEEIRKAMKELHYISEVDGLSYKDLCIHPNLDLPEGFKVPKFVTFNGTGNPLAHLRVYCDQLVGVGKNESLLMRLFGRSLSGEALEWLTSQELKQWKSWNALAKDFTERFGHNVEDSPDRYYLEKIKQKSTENYREYAFRWRKEAARVQPPMSEREITEMFIRTQEPEYYERMLCMMGQKFVEIVKVGEALEDGFKTGKLTRFTALRSNGKSARITDTDKSKGKVEEVSVVTATHMRPAYQRKYQNHNTDQEKFPRPKFRKAPKVFTPLRESQTQLYERLKAMGMLYPIEGRPANPLGKFYRADHRCAYHSGAVGHDTENCSTLKHKIQNMINNNLINIEETT
ncbi:uncharacterized protein [Solanum lycopersicum]|uniref:uncharacterized protein n=1 Tax=Solanum lycopersicum TaxID=4081 RepID=UPI00374A2066